MHCSTGCFKIYLLYLYIETISYYADDQNIMIKNESISREDLYSIVQTPYKTEAYTMINHDTSTVQDSFFFSSL